MSNLRQLDVTEKRRRVLAVAITRELERLRLQLPRLERAGQHSAVAVVRDDINALIHCANALGVPVVSSQVRVNAG
jgi:hypothetical protein